MLHVTNGDSAVTAIRATGVEGEILPWRDVLHEGPVPAPATLDSLRAVRARFLAAQGWGTAVELAREIEERDRRLARGIAEGEVVLWFEHDLYDQLQLAQVLDWFASARRGGAAETRLTLAQSDDYLGPMAAERLRALFESRREVTDAQLEAAQRAWGAFASSDPRALEAVLDTLDALPFMRASLVRHLEEFPAVENGLSRTERQTLETLVVGSYTFQDLFHAAHHDREEPIFLGDAVFLSLLRALAAGEEPLLRMDNEKVWLTDVGRAVLAGNRDRVETLGIDRWLGGVHLKGRRVPFRWSAAARELVASPVPGDEKPQRH